MLKEAVGGEAVEQISYEQLKSEWLSVRSSSFFTGKLVLGGGLLAFLWGHGQVLTSKNKLLSCFDC